MTCTSSSVDRPPVLALATSRSEMDPAWRPDRTEIAFATDRTGRAEIWLRSQKGDFDERPVVTPSDFSTPTYLLSAPAFSPDGKTLAYNRAGPEGMQIWVSGIPGGRPIQLWRENGAQDWPSWSPTTRGSRMDLRRESRVVKKIGPRTDAGRDDRHRYAAFSPLQWFPTETGLSTQRERTGAGVARRQADSTASRTIVDGFAWAVDAQRVYGSD